MLGGRQQYVYVERGKLVAQVLSGAWRPAPPPLYFSPPGLKEIAPLLLGAGAASLGWRHVRDAELAASRMALQLRQAYRHHTLRAALQERDVSRTVALLQS